jgi:hypothetical protein
LGLTNNLKSGDVAGRKIAPEKKLDYFFQNVPQSTPNFSYILEDVFGNKTRRIERRLSAERNPYKY